MALMGKGVDGKVHKEASQAISNHVLLLMVQKSQTTTGMFKSAVNNGINYQPQLVQDFSHQQYFAVGPFVNSVIWIEDDYIDVLLISHDFLCLQIIPICSRIVGSNHVSL